MEPLDEFSYKLTILYSLYEYIYYEIVYWIKEYSIPLFLFSSHSLWKKDPLSDTNRSMNIHSSINRRYDCSRTLKGPIHTIHERNHQGNIHKRVLWAAKTVFQGQTKDVYFPSISNKKYLVRSKRKSNNQIEEDDEKPVISSKYALFSLNPLLISIYLILPDTIKSFSISKHDLYLCFCNGTIYYFYSMWYSRSQQNWLLV